MSLADKVVVVTGSTRGIGRAIAEACAEEGAAVVVSSRSAAAVEETAAALRARGRRASGCPADVSRAGDLEGLLHHAVDTWGRVDVWVNNAGLSAGYRYISDIPAGEIDALVDVNLKGTLQACRLLIPYFIHGRGGVLLNLSGRGGRLEPSPFLTVYGATKAAVTSLTASLAREYRGWPVSIHSLIPGMVDTDFYRNVPTSPGLMGQMKGIRYVLRAFGIPLEEVGRAAARIAAQRPGRITGRQYRLLKGWKLAGGMARMIGYRVSGKVGKG